MKAMIYCESDKKGTLKFYIRSNGEDYFLFTQTFRVSVARYYRRGVTVDQALRLNQSKMRNHAMAKITEKLPSYLRYLEREYSVQLLRGKNISEKKIKTTEPSDLDQQWVI